MEGGFITIHKKDKYTSTCASWLPSSLTKKLTPPEKLDGLRSKELQTFCGKKKILVC